MYTKKDTAILAALDLLEGLIKAGTAPKPPVHLCERYACRLMRIELERRKIEIEALRRVETGLRGRLKSYGVEVK